MAREAAAIDVGLTCLPPPVLPRSYWPYPPYPEVFRRDSAETNIQRTSKGGEQTEHLQYTVSYDVLLELQCTDFVITVYPLFSGHQWDLSSVLISGVAYVWKLVG